MDLLPVGPIGTVTAGAGGGRHPAGHLPGLGDVRQQRDRLRPAHRGDRRGLPRRGVLFHTDAVQAAGHLHINVKEQNIDLLSLSGHKFHGPKGAGVLYARQGIPLTNVIEGGAQERGKRAGTENVPGIVGLAAALKEMPATTWTENAAKVGASAGRLIAGLSRIPHSALNGDPVHRLPGNVNFCFEGMEGESLLLLLDQAGICASSGSACTSGSLDPSHVLLAIGRPHEVAHGSLRLSLCEWNTQEDVDHILKEVPGSWNICGASLPCGKSWFAARSSSCCNGAFRFSIFKSLLLMMNPRRFSIWHSIQKQLWITLPIPGMWARFPMPAASAKWATPSAATL